MESPKEQAWKHAITGVDGNTKLFGVNIFKYKWKNTNELATVHDPLYGQEYQFLIYTVTIHGQQHTFAAGEFSNCVWGFFTPAD